MLDAFKDTAITVPFPAVACVLIGLFELRNANRLGRHGGGHGVTRND